MQNNHSRSAYRTFEEFEAAELGRMDCLGETVDDLIDALFADDDEMLQCLRDAGGAQECESGGYTFSSSNGDDDRRAA